VTLPGHLWLHPFRSADQHKGWITSKGAGHHLHLTVIKGYLVKLLGNARVVRYLMQHRPEFLTEFQTITEMTSTLPPEAA